MVRYAPSWRSAHIRRHPPGAPPAARRNVIRHIGGHPWPRREV